MPYNNAVRLYPAGISAAGGLGAIDINDAADTSEYTWDPVSPCWIYAFGGTCTEATGTQTTTTGVGSLEIGGTEHSAATAGTSAAIGTEVQGSQFDPVYVAAGTDVEFVNKTQAAGGTVTGEYAGWVLVEIFHNVAPA